MYFVKLYNYIIIQYIIIFKRFPGDMPPDPLAYHIPHKRATFTQSKERSGYGPESGPGLLLSIPKGLQLTKIIYIRNLRL